MNSPESALTAVWVSLNIILQRGFFLTTSRWLMIINKGNNNIQHPDVLIESIFKLVIGCLLIGDTFFSAAVDIITALVLFINIFVYGFHLMSLISFVLGLLPEWKFSVMMVENLKIHHRQFKDEMTRRRKLSPKLSHFSIT